MEMEGRDFSQLLRSSTEEILINSVMDNPIAKPIPSMEMLGFKNTKQPFRADSEHFFNSWLMSGEIPASGVTHRTRQASMRSAAMQDSQLTFFPQAPHNGSDGFKQELENTTHFCNVPMAEMPNQLRTFLSPSHSSISFSPPIVTTDTVSSLVSMLKGNLERKKNDDDIDKTFEVRPYGMLTSREAACTVSSIQGAGNQATIFNMLFPGQVAIEKSLELNMRGFATEANHVQIGTISQEPSQSESSTAAAAAISAGFEVFDGIAQSGPIYQNLEYIVKGFSELESKTMDLNKNIFENSFKDSRKRESLARMDSISSGASVDMADPTKKRRVERSRKMAEAKEKISTPSLPSDMQEIVKRCENLEKEVRSLKLNRTFMNRKDSEQSRQIEDLQKQNEELTEQKLHLSGEIERIMSVWQDLRHSSSS